MGCGGSGKTTFGRRLAARLGIQIVHLDAVYYDDRWNTMEPDEFAAVQEELVTTDRWVIDGNYASTLPIRLRRADTVIFLDLPALTCLWGIAQRCWRHRGGQHDDTGVHDRVTWSFVKYVWGYRREMAPRVRALIAEHAWHADVHIVKSRRAANRLLAGLDASPTTT
ncbi:P-loop NTPase family protein [Actinomadura craniellae]|nr:topology modulation protein [Actinomadura craniellae]